MQLYARNDRLPGARPQHHAHGLWQIQGDTLIANDALSYGLKVVPRYSAAGPRSAVPVAIIAGTDTLEKADQPTAPAPAPTQWDGLIGEYGWDHNTLYILEKEGKLHTLIEWFFEYPLEPMGRDTFSFPAYGLYDGEKIVFRRDPRGHAYVAEAASVLFTRRLTDLETGRTFKIKPLRPVEELRREALSATPPAEAGTFLAPDLVELRSLDPTIKYDIRYATTNNFMNAVFYPVARALLQRPGPGAGTCAAHTEGEGLRPAHPRCLPALVRYEDVLGCHARTAQALRGQPGQRLTAQPRRRR